jgi:hypothetical protein
MLWMLLVLPAVVFATFAALLPRPGPPPRWRLRLAELLERVAGRLRRRAVAPDPFEVLRLQMRLGVLADQVRALEQNTYVYAKAHRLYATRAAYDDLLEEACRLAGVRLDPAGHRSEAERMREEVELAARGWSW